MAKEETKKTHPFLTVRDGGLKVTVWKNDGDKGTFYSAKFVRSYKDGAEFKETDSINSRDLPRVAALLIEAYTKTREKAGSIGSEE